MHKPLQITTRNMQPSESVALYVRQRVSKLDRLCPRITGCHVTIESPHRHKTHGHEFRVRIDLSVPGTELVIGRTPSPSRANQNAYAALDAAFDDARRVLTDYVRRQHEA
jgi:ribosome-associated translation inhibitor RaiA